jgi:hypothetical protein
MTIPDVNVGTSQRFVASNNTQEETDRIIRESRDRFAVDPNSLEWYLAQVSREQVADRLIEARTWQDLLTSRHLHPNTTYAIRRLGDVGGFRPSDDLFEGDQTDATTPANVLRRSIWDSNAGWTFRQSVIRDTTARGDAMRNRGVYAVRQGSYISSSQPITEAAYDKFFIEYINPDGLRNRYFFAFMPAIQNSLSSPTSQQVPEIKPGLLQRTDMEVKPFVIPGAPPVYQILGHQSTVFQLVGLLVGLETYNIPYGVGGDLNAYNPNVSLNAYQTARLFETEVVQLGKQVDMVIYSSQSMSDAPLLIRYKGIIQSFRYFIARSDRVYYSLELVILDSKHHTNSRIDELITEEALIEDELRALISEEGGDSERTVDVGDINNALAEEEQVLTTNVYLDTRLMRGSREALMAVILSSSVFANARYIDNTVVNIFGDSIYTGRVTFFPEINGPSPPQVPIEPPQQPSVPILPQIPGEPENNPQLPQERTRYVRVNGLIYLRYYNGVMRGPLTIGQDISTLPIANPVGPIEEIDIGTDDEFRDWVRRPRS